MIGLRGGLAKETNVSKCSGGWRGRPAEYLFVYADLLFIISIEMGNDKGNRKYTFDLT